MDKEATKPKAKEDTDGPEEVPLEDSPSLPEENLLNETKEEETDGPEEFPLKDWLSFLARSMGGRELVEKFKTLSTQTDDGQTMERGLLIQL